MIDFLLLVLARWLHFGAVMILFGSSLLRMYCVAPATPSTRLLRFATPIACASALAWVAGSIILVTGDVASLYDPDVLSAYFFDTQFGRAWLICLAILVLLTALVFAPGRTFAKAKARPAALLVVSGALLVGQAWLGHAAAGSPLGASPPIIAYATHVVAVGAWLGGLPALAELMASPIEPGAIEPTLRRFSTMGIISIALILVSGIANSLFRIASLTAAAKTAYGQTIAIKIVLLVLLLGLAAQNRFHAMPRLAKAVSALPALAILKRNVIIEQAVGAAILLAAAVLGLLSPSG
jgi:putative copper resistance protein D